MRPAASQVLIWSPLRQPVLSQGAPLYTQLQGGGDADFYYFRHWHAIDLFVYFSHHLVTIPPVGWVNAGHRHGVPVSSFWFREGLAMLGSPTCPAEICCLVCLPSAGILALATILQYAALLCHILPCPSSCCGPQVLGTLITEWEQGAANCRQLFGSLAAAEHTATQLAAIAQAYGFDGWVINIENAVDPQHVPNLIHFLRSAARSFACRRPECEGQGGEQGPADVPR